MFAVSRGGRGERSGGVCASRTAVDLREDDRGNPEEIVYIYILRYTTSLELPWKVYRNRIVALTPRDTGLGFAMTRSK